MDKLKTPRLERFAQFIALEDCDVAEACYRAGYGRDAHPCKDSYHINMGSRLIKRDDVQLRIHTIREQNSKNDKDFKTSLIEDLKKIIKFDEGQYLQSSNCVLPNGRTVTDVYYSRPIQDWPQEDRALMINGFDVQGRPKFIDKQWAWEKLLKIYQLDGKQTVDVEDLMGLLSSAGLPVVPPASLSKSENKEIEKELDDDK